MFEYVDMSVPIPTSRSPAAEEIARLRSRIERIERMNRTGGDSRTLPVAPSLARLLPGGGLRAGAAYCLDRSMSLLLRLIAEPSRAGTWCTAIGMPELGIEAAREAGAELERLVLIPRPGERWLSVIATVAEVMGLVAVRPASRVREQDAARLAARLRERGTVLLVQGPWPHAEATLRLEAAEFSGLGEGHGHLERLEADIAVVARQTGGGPRRGRVTLLGGGPDAPRERVADAGEQAPAARLQAVG